MKENPYYTCRDAINEGHITEEICLGMKWFENVNKKLQEDEIKYLRKIYEKCLEKNPKSALGHFLVGNL